MMELRMAKFIKKGGIFLPLLLLVSNAIAQDELLVDFADSPGSTKTTIFNTPNCIAGFNQSYGTSIIEGLNVINGEQIYVGVGRAIVEFNTDGKNASGQTGSWAKALRMAQMKAELRAKQTVIISRKIDIQEEVILETSSAISEGERPVMLDEGNMSTLEKVKFVVLQKLDEFLELDALEYEQEEREAAVRDIIAQDRFQSVINASAYAEMTGMQTVYTNYYQDKNEFCSVVMKNNDSSMMANALSKNNSRLLKADISKASETIKEQLEGNFSRLLFTHGIRVLRDEKGELVLVVYVVEPYKKSESKTITGRNSQNAESNARLRAGALVSNFIEESINVELKTSIEEIVTTFDGKAEDGSELSEYFSEESTESRIEASSANSVVGLSKQAGGDYMNPISNEPVYIYIGSISAGSLRDVALSKLKGINRERL
jgi:hypothetical protein